MFILTRIFSSHSLTRLSTQQMITLGGNAELELVDSLDPFSEGIIFSVMPPKKSWKNISNLSGGEKVHLGYEFDSEPCVILYFFRRL